MNLVRSFLRRHGRVALDTSILIYHLKPNDKYQPLTSNIFSWLDLPDSEAVLSTVTMTELLVQPIGEGNESTVERYYSTLTGHPNLHWLAPDLEIARLAAQFRAHYRLKTIDALIAATAVHGSATALITNDAELSRVDGLEILVLESLL